jgi:predicted AlkP superfamily phosphohydrolase/phosphomutase
MLPDRLKRLATEVDSRVELNLGAIDWSSTSAYWFPMHHPVEAVMINLRGRQPEGIVEPGEAWSRLREEIKERLLDLKDPDTGERVVEKVFMREEIQKGRRFEESPDMYLLFREGYEGDPSLDAPVVDDMPREEITRLSGSHRFDGFLGAAGPGVDPGGGPQGASIVDLAPLILYSLGVPIPRHYQGRIPEGVYTEAWLASHPPEFTDVTITAPTRETALTGQEEEEMREKLRGLGYM